MSNPGRVKISKHSQAIARSINLSFFTTIFSYFLSFNLIVILLFSYFSLLDVENQIHLVQSQLQIVDNNIVSSIDRTDLTIEIDERRRETPITNVILSFSPLDNVIQRRLQFNSFFNFAIFSSYSNLTYQVQLSHGPEFITFTFDLSHKIQTFFTIYFWILIIQTLTLISTILKQSRKTRIALHPINTLSASTKDLQKDISNLAVRVDTKQLNSIAQAIERIDAQKLDHQLSISNSSTEYAQLTEAINDMLIRINQAVASQTQFVSDASHELRTPISIIQGYINLLDRWGKEDPATLQESIDAIKNETENMKTLVENLLFLARGDSDHIQLILESIDTQFLLEEVIKETKFIDPERSIQLFCDTSVQLVADRQLIKQALRILLDNAMKYSDRTFPITIRCNTKDQHFICSISDQGIGISPDNIERVFDRFYRDEQARATKTKGSGLGLSIAKWIVEKHQGTIEIVSRKDIGTKVILHLPILKR